MSTVSTWYLQEMSTEWKTVQGCYILHFSYSELTYAKKSSYLSQLFLVSAQCFTVCLFQTFSGCVIKVRRSLSLSCCLAVASFHLSM